MTHDVLIIGSGAAGLTAALALAKTKKVLVLAKGDLRSGSTAWAQGGIAAVLDAGDTFENHVRDTMVAGAGLNRRETRSNGWSSWACRSMRPKKQMASPTCI
jgi:L-aspartate oxidase